MKKITRRNVVYATTVVCVTTVVSVVVLAAMLTGMMKSKKRTGLGNDKSEANQYDVLRDALGSNPREDESETIKYSHQDKISEDVWEQEPDSDGKRYIMIVREGIMNEEFEAAFYEKYGFLPSDYEEKMAAEFDKMGDGSFYNDYYAKMYDKLTEEWDNYIINSRAVKKDLLRKYNDDFLEKYSINREWVLPNYSWFIGRIIMYADENLIRKMAEDESVIDITAYEDIIISNFD